MNKKMSNILKLIKTPPYKETKYISLKEMLECDEYVKKISPLAIPLGKDELGKPVIIDFAKLGNLLISSCFVGGTVCIWDILISLIYRNSQEDLKIIYINAMKVNMSLFFDIPYMLFPKGIWTKEECFQMIDYLEKEIDSRIKSKEILPKIIVVIDGWEDFISYLKMYDLVKKDKKYVIEYDEQVKEKIARILSLANNVGIYFVTLTNRPIKSSIPDDIKEEFPNRLAFATATELDSCFMIGQKGAESLLGKWDGLLKTKKGIQHLQCAFINVKDINEITKYLKKQSKL